MNNLEIPIVIFAYNRPEILKETLSSLKANIGIENHPIIFFFDGPKDNASPEILKKIDQTRACAESVDWCKEVTVHAKDKNVGLANSLVGGITEVLKDYEAIIVLEDDIKTAPYFLKYMVDALTFYKDKDEVSSICGFSYPLSDISNSEETYFIRGTKCWGWATWKRGWVLYDNDGQKLLDQLVSSNGTYDFDFNGTYPYSKMLARTILDNHSWAIKWYAAAYLKNKLTLHPRDSLVVNIGVEGTNIEAVNPMLLGNTISNKPVEYFTENLSESILMRNKIGEHYKKYFGLFYRIRLLFAEHSLAEAISIIVKRVILKAKNEYMKINK